MVWVLPGVNSFYFIELSIFNHSSLRKHDEDKTKMESVFPTCCFLCFVAFNRLLISISVDINVLMLIDLLNPLSVAFNLELFKIFSYKSFFFSSHFLHFSSHRNDLGFKKDSGVLK